MLKRRRGTPCVKISHSGTTVTVYGKYGVVRMPMEDRNRVRE